MGYSKQFIEKVNDGSAGPTIKNLMQYNVDTEAEISLLTVEDDVAAGSYALALDHGVLYMLDSTRHFVKVGS